MTTDCQETLDLLNVNDKTSICKKNVFVCGNYESALSRNIPSDNSLHNPEIKTKFFEGMGFVTLPYGVSRLAVFGGLCLE